MSPVARGRRSATSPNRSARGSAPRWRSTPAAAPQQRPDWFRAGWYDRVEAWIDDCLVARGSRRTEPVRTHRVWSISAVLEVPTSDGVLWFKACCDHFRAEAAILHRLSDRLPDLVPIVVAADDAEGWLLMEPLAGASDRAAGAPEALAPVWAAAQLASLGWLDELRAAGCPDRGLGPTLAAWRSVLAHDPEMALLTDDERAAVLGSADEVEARVRELWSTGLPDTLAHGDLHPGNVAYDGQDPPRVRLDRRVHQPPVPRRQPPGVLRGRRRLGRRRRAAARRLRRAVAGGVPRG